MLDRRTFLTSAAATAALAGFPAVAWGQAGGAGDLERLLASIFEDSLADSPERATSLGLDKGDKAGLKHLLDDRSAAGRARRLERSKAQLAALGQIDRAGLGAEARLDYDVIGYQLKTLVQGSERFAYGNVGGRYVPYVISQLAGAYQDIPDFLDNQHSVADKADADAWLDRLHAFAKGLDQDTERSRVDAASGVIPPDYVVDTTLGQLRALRGRPAAETELVQSLARKAKAAGLTDDYAGPAEAIVRGEVFPALDRQIALVEGLRAKATHDAGVWKLPDGEAYYAGGLAAATTTTLPPDEVHRLGLEQVAEITGRIDTILKAQGMSKGTPAERLTALNDQPSQLYPNTDQGRAEMIDWLNGQIAAMYAKLPQAFSTLPKAKVTVKRVPPNIQDGAPNGYYQRAALDGSRDAIYFINLKDAHEWPRFSLPTLTYHEAVPGHHLQVSLQQQSTAIPLLRRTTGFAAYSEGWALYAEQLADELGFYEGDPWGRAGYLQSFLFRAVRLVVDSGMHAKRWSRERATQYMIDATGYAPSRVQREIDRYCVWPGQACSYKVGHTVWMRLRQEAQAKLGSKFDLKAFHDAGLNMGAMPLTVLEGSIRAWSATI